MINTRFWNDGFISGLEPLEKLLFIYFLTNKHTNIGGIYELPSKVIAMETGIDPSMLEKMLPRLETRIIYHDNWVILTRFPKHQNLKSADVIKGILREFDLVPKHVREVAIKGGWGDGLGMVLDHLGIAPDTKPNLTILNTTRSQSSRGVISKKKAMKGYNENSSYEEKAIDLDTGEEITSNNKSMVGASMKFLLNWSIERRGFPFVNNLKQYAAFKRARLAKIQPDDLRARWQEFEVDKFYKEKGFDWGMVVSSFDKRR